MSQLECLAAPTDLRERMIKRFARLFVGTPPEKDPLTRSEGAIVWLCGIAVFSVFVIIVPFAVFQHVVSDVAAAEKAGKVTVLGCGNTILLWFSILSAVVGSIFAGGIFKIATERSAVQWSFYALLACLVGIAWLGDFAGIVRAAFSDPQPGTSTKVGAALTFSKGGWVIWWVSTIVVLVGWTLKGPWDRCMKAFGDVTTKVITFLQKPHRWDRIIAAVLTSFHVATASVDSPAKIRPGHDIQRPDL